MKITNKTFMAIIVWVCVSVVLTCATQDKDYGNKDKNFPGVTGPEPNLVVDVSLPHGPVKDGLAAFLMCPRNQFKVGEPIRLMYGILFRGPEWDMTEHPPAGAVNVGLKFGAPVPIWIMIIQRPSGLFVATFDSRLSIKGPDDNDVPRVRGVIGCFPKANPNNRIELAAGSFLGKTSFDLRRAYEFNTPGIYTIRWHYQGWHDHRIVGGDAWWAGELVSNEVQVEIVK